MKRKIPGTESAGDVTETHGLYHEFIAQEWGAVALVGRIGTEAGPRRAAKASQRYLYAKIVCHLSVRLRHWVSTLLQSAR